MVKINSPKGRLVEIDGIRYQVINGVLYRYANLTLDKGFKIVLGSIGSEDVLRHLLNRLLGTKIKRLEYRNTEHPGMTEDERSSRFDVYCEDDDGRGFEVEMQNWSQKYYNKRAVYYSSLVLLDQAAKEQQVQRDRAGGTNWKRDYNFKPLYVVSFLNFSNWTSRNLLKKANDHIYTYRYAETETKEELGDGTNLVFIDLYGFKKTIEECESLEDDWMYSIKNMFSMTECPEKIKGTEIEALYRRSELAAMTTEQRVKLEESIMTENDILNSIAEQVEDARTAAIAEGRAEGLIEGRAEGRSKGLIEGRAEGRATAINEVICKMAEAGLPVSQIADIMNMTTDRVQEIIVKE